MLVNISNIREKYLYDFKYRQSILNKPFNYVGSGTNTLVAHIRDDNPTKYYISVLNLDFVPLFTYEVDAFISGCNISTSGRYIVWQTGVSLNRKSTDQNSIFLFDVLNKELVIKIEAPVSSKYFTGIFVDIQPGIIEVLYDEISFKYTFDGTPINYEKSFQKLLKTNFVSPYVWNEQASKIIDALDCEFNKGVENEVLCRINAAESNPTMSTYQLSLTYKKLGDCYLKHNLKEKALKAYRKGLSYNQKLSVKKVINQLEKTFNTNK